MKTYPDGSHPMVMTSRQLLALARRQKRTIEAFLSGGCFRATHFVAHEGGLRYWDEGIDGEERTVTRREFLHDYPEALGYIWWAMSTQVDVPSPFRSARRRLRRVTARDLAGLHVRQVFEVPPDCRYRQYGNFAVIESRRGLGADMHWTIRIWAADKRPEGTTAPLALTLSGTPVEISSAELVAMTRWSQAKHKEPLRFRRGPRTGYVVLAANGVTLEAAWDILEGRITRQRAIPAAASLRHTPIDRRHTVLPSGATCQPRPEAKHASA